MLYYGGLASLDLQTHFPMKHCVYFSLNNNIGGGAYVIMNILSSLLLLLYYDIILKLASDLQFCAYRYFGIEHFSLKQQHTTHNPTGFF